MIEQRTEKKTDFFAFDFISLVRSPNPNIYKLKTF